MTPYPTKFFEKEILLLEMEQPQPETMQALQNFLTIWRQDPISQQTLTITTESVLVWNLLDPEQATDITSLIEWLPLQETESIEDSQKEKSKELETTKTERILQDLRQPVKLLLQTSAYSY